jgi:hypothetical protein
MPHVNLTLKDNGGEVVAELLDKLGIDHTGLDLGSLVVKEGSAGLVNVTYVASMTMPRAQFQPYLELLVAADSHGRALPQKASK